jgi:hypothetical protein
MSRELPARPNLEFLKKQAKELLRELQQSKPTTKLSDAQHALAREYGFASWPALHAQVERDGQAAVPSPFTGAWIWTSPSTSDAAEPYRSVTMQFEVLGDVVTITDVVVDASGREQRTINTLQADGKEYSQPHGYAIAARWSGPRVLEAVGSKDGRVEGSVRYEVSADGNTLMLSTNDRQLRLTRR